MIVGVGAAVTPSTDLPNAVLTHENCGLRVVRVSYREMRQLQNNLSGDVGVPVRSEQELRGLEKRGAPSVTTGIKLRIALAA